MNDRRLHMSSASTTIYLNLLDENVDVRRPVRAEHIDGNIYLILNQPYDRTNERWEFEPGSRVVCEPVETNGGSVLTAVRRAE
jgi:hypothetical protein